MARIRSIHPSIWTDESFGPLTHRQQLLFIGAFSNADDHGKLNGSAAYIATVVLPYHRCKPTEIERDLAAIADAMRAFIYWEDTDTGKRYIQFYKWSDYQHPRFSGPDLLPDFEPDNPAHKRLCSNVTVGLRKSYRKVSDSRVESSRVESSRVESSSVADAIASDARLTPLIDAFGSLGIGRDRLSDGWLLRTVDRYPKQALPVIVEACVSYYRSKGKAVKDWAATFFRWCQNEERYQAERNGEAMLAAGESKRDTEKKRRYLSAADFEDAKPPDPLQQEIDTRFRELVSAAFRDHVKPDEEELMKQARREVTGQ